MIKRFFDIVVVILALPLVLPVFLITALMVRAKLGAPIFFSQTRGGYGGKRFRLWKFRSMTDARDANGVLLPDAERLIPFGKFLRSSSLDELPCLWNVLRGDMSIVGPRPFMADYLDLYTPEQMRRHDARPGITGWAQVNYPYGASVEDAIHKLSYDLYYLKKNDLLLDVAIMLQTIRVILFAIGGR